MKNQVRGFSVDTVPLHNPRTGEPYPVRHENLVFVDPDTGALAVLNQDTPIQCTQRCLIPEGEDLAFCGVCHRPTCRIHSVVDPICGRILCLEDSRLLDINGVLFRVCDPCFRRVREAWLRHLIRFVFGRR